MDGTFTYPASPPPPPPSRPDSARARSRLSQSLDENYGPEVTREDMKRPHRRVDESIPQGQGQGAPQYNPYFSGGYTDIYLSPDSTATSSSVGQSLDESYGGYVRRLDFDSSEFDTTSDSNPNGTFNVGPSPPPGSANAANGTFNVPPPGAANGTFNVTPPGPANGTFNVTPPGAANGTFNMSSPGPSNGAFNLSSPISPDGIYNALHSTPQGGYYPPYSDNSSGPVIYYNTNDPYPVYSPQTQAGTRGIIYPNWRNNYDVGPYNSVLERAMQQKGGNRFLDQRKINQSQVPWHLLENANPPKGEDNYRPGGLPFPPPKFEFRDYVDNKVQKPTPLQKEFLIIIHNWTRKQMVQLRQEMEKDLPSIVEAAMQEAVKKAVTTQTVLDVIAATAPEMLRRRLQQFVVYAVDNVLNVSLGPRVVQVMIQKMAAQLVGCSNPCRCPKGRGPNGLPLDRTICGWDNLDSPGCKNMNRPGPGPGPGPGGNCTTGNCSDDREDVNEIVANVRRLSQGSNKGNNSGNNGTNRSQRNN